jgi:Tol biopolymer transport system component
MQHNGIPADAIEAQLSRILASPTFSKADRATRFLRFAVRQYLEGRSSELKEYVVGVEVLGRKPDFDPRVDTIVRAEAQRLRTRLDEYYAAAGKHDSIRISIPKGTYVPSFELNGGVPEGMTVPEPVRSSRRYLLWLGLAAGLIAVGVAFYLQRVTQASRIPVVTRSVRLTNDEFSKSPELTTDGPRIYFSAWKGGRGVLAQVPSAGGPTELMPIPSIGPDTSTCLRGISHDGQQVLVVTGKQRTSLAGYTLWTVRPSTLDSRRVGNLVANDAGWSPDDRHIAYATENQIWIADPDGANAHKIAEQGGLTGYPRWSPDGRRIRFTSLAWDTYQQTIWEVPATGGTARPVFPGWQAEQWAGQWTPDGNYFVFNSGSDIWAVREHAPWPSKASKPVRLTSGPLSFLAPLPSLDGRKLFAVGEIRRGELLRYDAKHAELVPSFPGLSADGVDFSRDGEWMTYVTYPQNELWRSRLDGSRRQQLTAAPMKVNSPRWSPDGRRIAFNGRLPGQVWKGYLIRAEGGTPKEIAAGPVPGATWSPDGARVIVAAGDEPRTSLFVLDLRTGKLSPVPGSDGIVNPNWSPNGNYIVAERGVDSACMLFDFEKQAWSEIASKSCWWPNWTRDSRSFFSLVGKGEAIRRYDVETRKFEQLVSLKDYRITGNYLAWLGMSPDGSPLILRDAGSQEIYALEWQAR